MELDYPLWIIRSIESCLQVQDWMTRLYKLHKIVFEEHLFFASILFDRSGRLGSILWGRSSVGRAPDLHSGGRRFDPVRLHQSNSFRNLGS